MRAVTIWRAGLTRLGEWVKGWPEPVRVTLGPVVFMGFGAAVCLAYFVAITLAWVLLWGVGAVVVEVLHHWLAGS